MIISWMIHDAVSCMAFSLQDPFTVHSVEYTVKPFALIFSYKIVTNLSADRQQK